MMLLSPDRELTQELESCVQSVRSQTGKRELDIMWNRDAKRWVLIQRSDEAKFGIDPLVMGCLPHDRIPEKTNIRALFAIETESGGYAYPPSRLSSIVAKVNQRTIRAGDPRFHTMWAEQKARKEESLRKWNADFEQDLRRELTNAVNGRVTVSG